MRDFRSNLDVAPSLVPDDYTNGTHNGSAVDLRGFDAATVVVLVGTVTDGTHTPKVQESDDGSTFTDVAAGDLIGALAALATGVNQRAGYRGTKRYLRAVLTTSGATTGAQVAATVVRGRPAQAPLA